MANILITTVLLISVCISLFPGVKLQSENDEKEETNVGTPDNEGENEGDEQPKEPPPRGSGHGGHGGHGGPGGPRGRGPPGGFGPPGWHKNGKFTQGQWNRGDSSDSQGGFDGSGWPNHEERFRRFRNGGGQGRPGGFGNEGGQDRQGGFGGFDRFGNHQGGQGGNQGSFERFGGNGYQQGQPGEQGGNQGEFDRFGGNGQGQPGGQGGFD